VVQWKGIRPWWPEYGQKGSILFLDHFFILGDAVKLPDGWGRAHSALFGLLMSPKDGCARVRTGAHARLKPTRTLYQSKKNVRNEMKKIRQTNFTQLQVKDYPKM
jgi:hypothetical protein